MSPVSVSNSTLSGEANGDGNHPPESWQVCSGVGAYGEGEGPDPPPPDAEPPLPHRPPAHSPRAGTPAQEPEALGSKPPPDSVLSRTPGLYLDWEGSSKVESPCSLILG